MNHLIGLTVCLITVLTLAGCGTCPTTLQDNVTVTVEGPGRFPAELAGRWRADRDGWELVFEPDGHIASAVISLGRVRVVPGQTTTRATRSGGQSEFKPGPWTVSYEPATGELTVKIVMDHVRVEMADTVIEGTSTDAFSGAISPTDGLWQVQWTTFTQYTAIRMLFPSGLQQESETMLRSGWLRRPAWGERGVLKRVSWRGLRPSASMIHSSVRRHSPKFWQLSRASTVNPWLDIHAMRVPSGEKWACSSHASGVWVRRVSARVFRSRV